MSFLLFGVGVVLTIVGVILFILMFVHREVEFWTTISALGAFLIGFVLLWVTIPDLKSIITKDFDVVKGKCTVEVVSSGSSLTDTTFNMIDTDEEFFTDGVPALDAYGEAIPYYCEITVTPKYGTVIDYKFYDLKTGKRMD